LRRATRLVAVLTILLEVATQAGVRSADWGEPSHGLQCRAAPNTNRLEQGTRLEVEFELQAGPAHLPHGIRHLNAFLCDAYVKLSLTNTTGTVN
jgi:hypothetical protein